MSAPTQDTARLDRPVDPERDRILGPATAPITLVEYGSYACPHCRVANERIGSVRTEFGDRLRYVFRHRPLTGSEIARRARFHFNEDQTFLVAKDQVNLTAFRAEVGR